MITVECECVKDSPTESTFNMRLLRSAPRGEPSILLATQSRFSDSANRLDIGIILSNFVRSFGGKITDRPAAQDDSADAARYRWLKEKNAAALACVAWRSSAALAEMMDGANVTPGTLDHIVDLERGATK